MQFLKKLLRRLDFFSPFPLFYPFIMTKNEKFLFDRKIRNSNNYLEFGLGGSTLRALRKSRAKIYTVESSPEWLSSVRKYLVFRYFENKRVFVSLVDIGSALRANIK